MNVVALAGGTGGAKLAHGLQAALAPGELTVIVNTGDDTERHGLLVMPDHDAVMYMLAGRFDDERGWGIAGETWTVMDALADYGEEAWFRLGDRDFATHIARTARLRAGSDLTAVVRSLQTALGIATPILPMADAPVRTEVRVDEGWLEFQEYFVHRHQAPEVREVRFRGDLTPSAAVSGGHRRGRRHRHRAVEPDRVDRADPGRADPRSGRGTGRGGQSRSWPSARSSAGPRSRGRPTGCWSRSVTNRAPGEWPGSTAGWRRRSCSTRSTRPSSRTSRRSATGRSSPTRSWPTTTGVPGSPGPSSTSRWRRRRAGTP